MVKAGGVGGYRQTGGQSGWGVGGGGGRVDRLVDKAGGEGG